MFSPLVCGSSKAVELPASNMKAAKSVEKLHRAEGQSDFTSKVKSFLSNSPLKRRRAMSLSALNSSASTLVFEVPLVDLVAQEGRDIPRIVMKVVEHIEKEGLDQEGIYRVNGNAKVIEKFKTSFDKVGDADFRNQDIAAVAGLLKLFLRQLPTPLIPDDLVPEFVEIQQACPSTATPESLECLQRALGKLPRVNYSVVKYIMRHLVKVAQHSVDNRMTPVSLSIVFGPNIFRCGGGLEGLRQQGYTNPVVCKMIQHYHTLFEAPEGTATSLTGTSRLSVKQEEMKGGRKQINMRPYSDFVQVKKHEEESSHPLPPTSPASPGWDHDGSYSERSVDEAIDRSSGTLSPTSPTPMLNENSFQDAENMSPAAVFEDTSTLFEKSEPLVVEPYSEQQEGAVGEGVFRRQYAKRGRKPKPKHHQQAIGKRGKEPTIGKSKSEVTYRSKQGVMKHPLVSTLNPHEEEILRTPSPYSWQSSPGTSPPTSPALTPRSSKILSSVIEESVKHFLFEPPPPSPKKLQPDSLGHLAANGKVNVYSLLLPDKVDSPHVKRRRLKESERGVNEKENNDQDVQPPQYSTTEGDASKSELDSSLHLHTGLQLRSKPRGRDVKKLRNRRSALYGESDDGGSMGLSTSATSPIEDMNVQILSVSPPQGKGELNEEVVSQQGKVSELVQQFEETDSGIADSEPQQKGKESDASEPVARKKPKAFEMFEKSGIIMGMPAPPKLRKATQSSQGSEAEISSNQLPSDDLTAVTRPQISTTSASDEDVFTSPKHTSTHHIIGTTTAGRKKLSTTTSDDVFMHTPRHEQSFEEFDVVKFSGTLKHPTLDRPRGPAHRRPPKHYSSPVLMDVETTDGVGLQDGLTTYRSETAGKCESDASTPKKARRKVVSTSGIPSTKASFDSAVSPKPVKKTKAPVLDLTSLAPEKQSKDVKEAWTDVEASSRGGNETDSPPQTIKELSSRIHELKGMIREFEADFSASHGRKPSGSEKAPICSHVEEISQLRRQLKALKGKAPSEEKLSKTAPSEIPIKGSFPSDPELAETEPENTLKAVLEELLARLAVRRRKHGRPEDLKAMSPEQIYAEKQATQKILLQFEKQHGRPQTKEDKETMRPLYDHYRLVKKLMEESHAGAGINPEALEATSESLPSVTLLQSGLTQSLPLPVTSSQGATCETRLSTSVQEYSSETCHGRNGEMNKKQLSEATIDELHRQLETAMNIKKELRAILKDYENGFLAMHGRAVAKEDRKPMQKEYGEYRDIKAKLKLIETLITRKELLKTV